MAKREKKLRFALFGCGQAGMNHLESLCNTPGAEVVAVCDKREEAARAAARRYNIPSFYLDAGRLFRNERIDAIANVTSTGGHYPITMMAARRGIHVFLEKPMSASFRQAKEMADLCRKSGVILAVTFTYRFVPETIYIKETIDSGKLGRLLEVRYLRYNGNPHKYPPGSAMRRQRDNLNTGEGQGIVYDCGIHAIDLICWYAGHEPVKMDAWGTHHEGYDYPDTATCMLEFGNGVKGVYDYGSLSGSYENFGQGRALMSIIVNCEKGSIVYNLGINVAGRDNDTSYIDVLTSRKHTVKTFPIYEKCRDVQYRQFIESVRAGKLKGNFPGPEEAAKATMVAEKMLRLCLKNRIRSPLHT